MQLRVAGGHKLLGWCLLRSRITRAAETGSRYEIKERTANHIRTRHENCLSCFEKRLASMISCYSRTEKSSTLLFRLPVWSSSAFLQSKKLCSGKASPEFSNKLLIHSRVLFSNNYYAGLSDGRILSVHLQKQGDEVRYKCTDSRDHWLTVCGNSCRGSLKQASTRLLDQM